MNICRNIQQGEGFAMKFAKTLAIAAGAGLLSAAVMGSARYVYAQDEGEVEQNAEGWWTSEGIGGAGEESSPDAKKPPIDVAGCWQGTNQDRNLTLGTGDQNFHFVQNGMMLENTSNFFFFWNGGMQGATGTLKGSVSSTGIIFKGNTGTGCKIKGSGKGNASQITGKFKFSGTCKKEFESGTFTITPGCA